jgi:hypothetical protein
MSVLRGRQSLNQLGEESSPQIEPLNITPICLSEEEESIQEEPVQAEIQYQIIEKPLSKVQQIASLIAQEECLPVVNKIEEILIQDVLTEQIQPFIEIEQTIKLNSFYQPIEQFPLLEESVIIKEELIEKFEIMIENNLELIEPTTVNLKEDNSDIVIPKPSVTQENNPTRLIFIIRR